MRSQETNSYNTGTGLLQPVPDCAVKNDMLVWTAVNGAVAYRVVDIQRNAVTVKRTHYDMFDKLLVYGVYPVIDQRVVKSRELGATEIRYLDGAGTASEPYKIKTPFDLRAIDYYETLYAIRLADGIAPERNHYVIENDLDYSAIAIGDDETNIHTLSAPFYGCLDGNGKTLKGIRVNYDGGYWALFDFLASGSTIKDIIFDSPEITNALQEEYHPLNATVATVAYKNYGTISGITVANANYTASGGAVCGIAAHNSGAVSGCIVGGTFRLRDTGMRSQACYETAGIVLENLAGGTVSNNVITALKVEGGISNWHNGNTGGTYNNLRMVGGIVAYARRGGTVCGNGYIVINVKRFNADKQFEIGGIIASNEGEHKENVVTGEITVDGFAVSEQTGDNVCARGKLVGRQL